MTRLLTGRPRNRDWCSCNDSRPVLSAHPTVYRTVTVGCFRGKYTSAGVCSSPPPIAPTSSCMAVNWDRENFASTPRLSRKQADRCACVIALQVFAVTRATDSCSCACRAFLPHLGVSRTASKGIPDAGGVAKLFPSLCSLETIQQNFPRCSVDRRC
jgi:hypothetical protein